MGLWDKVIDQDETVDQLKAAGAEENLDRLPSSWGFTGPPGSGRTVLATAFAKYLLCSRSETSSDLADANAAETACENCHLIDQRTHPDVHFISTTGLTLGVQLIRDLINEANLLPARGKYRIFIIEDADRITETAQNALLKSIEEPPPHVLWILCAPTPTDLLQTSRSRLRIVKLRVPRSEAIVKYLTAQNVPAERAEEAAKLANGHIGIAKLLATSDNALDQRLLNAQLALSIRLVSDATFSAEELIKNASEISKHNIDQKYEAKRVELTATLGLEAEERIPPKLNHYFKQLEEDRKIEEKRASRDYIDVALQEILMVYRDIAVLQAGGSESLVINTPSLPSLRKYAQVMPMSETVSKIAKIEEARERLASNGLPQLVLEAMFAGLLIPERVVLSHT
jgi:DNA polymerase-3 subunit delta'